MAAALLCHCAEPLPPPQPAPQGEPQATMTGMQPVQEAGRDACVPQCTDRECGEDGCGGRCGPRCPAGFACDETVGKCARVATGSTEPNTPPDPDPKGSDASTPMDLMPEAGAAAVPPAIPACGNGTKDPGEECDGESFCSPACKVWSPEQGACLTTGDPTMSLTPECLTCGCTHCYEQLNACYSTGDFDRDEACQQIVDCAIDEKCTDGIACFCGGGNTCSSPPGPCLIPTQRALRTANPLALIQCFTNQDCALYRASRVGDCVIQKCAEACGLASDE